MSSRPKDWKKAAPPLAFAGQSALPKLPVPALPATLARLKDSLKPLAWTDNEYELAAAKIDDFARGQGPELQARLLKRADETEHWLEEWWDDGAYLGYRDSVVINVSYYYGFDDPPPHLPHTPVSRAAGLTRAAMLFRQRLKQGLIKPEATKEGPLCMDTYRWMFDCCRVPGADGLDWSVSYAKEGDTGDTGHVVVLRRGRVWRLDAAQNGRILSTGELERQFQHIYDQTTEEYPGVGVLTSNNRDAWAKDYATLLSSPHNASIIETIHSAAFLVCLDTETPSGPIEHSRFLWHGAAPPDGPLGLRNRWVDKPCQFIVFDNGRAGFMGEHSVMDGTPTARMCDEVLDALYDRAFDHGAPANQGVSVRGPSPLDWDVSPATEKAIAAADQAARALIATQALAYHLTPFGKAAVKAFGVSPDSFAQLAVQLAYLRLVGFDARKRGGGTYEAATTRRFAGGRTEAVRVVTRESDRWAWAMADARVGAEERRRLFREAAARHVQLAREAGRGEGVDRHMLGLRKCLRAGEPTPALYADPLFQRSSHWVLSTSAVWSKHFPVYGWGEVVPDGFGVAYMTGYDGE
ncbi:acyltransferase ChoActase/COT/CPT [Gloeophyllum trabeum ATCC 11539]|uniref:Acyltransferase ChoActase/COT/CPT n=1 Tax=Gloeophyllum trabeum (strain ATCC 11539 / FP-39264 / Madison 617) TaxID=670483 RepID=S7QB76_GLOTA|nr:acyltransferase ChoActase/COT/CPT [Gloeophyllum trabeum ATCC 11539]EPQ56572.1 acyltransferase ChoActase/COT/CPT [Gloeophyllum trabeum ATCC 11539]